MNTKLILLAATAIAALLIYSCGGNGAEQRTGKDYQQTPTETAPPPVGNDKGIGKFQHVELTDPLDEKMAAAGLIVYDVKCSSCHKLTDERIVGPGWEGVTERRTPEWIMNFITNVDEMLEKDPASIEMLEVCLVRMPNQNLSDEEARALLEFMRKNDQES